MHPRIATIVRTGRDAADSFLLIEAQLVCQGLVENLIMQLVAPLGVRALRGVLEGLKRILAGPFASLTDSTPSEVIQVILFELTLTISEIISILSGAGGNPISIVV